LLLLPLLVRANRSDDAAPSKSAIGAVSNASDARGAVLPPSCWAGVSLFGCVAARGTAGVGDRVSSSRSTAWTCTQHRAVCHSPRRWQVALTCCGGGCLDDANHKRRKSSTAHMHPNTEHPCIASMHSHTKHPCIAHIHSNYCTTVCCRASIAPIFWPIKHMSVPDARLLAADSINAPPVHRQACTPANLGAEELLPLPALPAGKCGLEPKPNPPKRSSPPLHNAPAETELSPVGHSHTTITTNDTSVTQPAALPLLHKLNPSQRRNEVRKG